jgi:hypothetical protein
VRDPLRFNEKRGHARRKLMGFGFLDRERPEHSLVAFGQALFILAAG